jgi:hypothetical protein
VLAPWPRVGNFLGRECPGDFRGVGREEEAKHGSGGISDGRIDRTVRSHRIGILSGAQLGQRQVRIEPSDIGRPPAIERGRQLIPVGGRIRLPELRRRLLGTGRRINRCVRRNRTRRVGARGDERSSGNKRAP